MGEALSNMVRQQQNSIVVGTTRAITLAVARFHRELPSTVNALAQAMGQRAIPRAQLGEINQGIARRAQSAVVNGYRSRLPRRSTGGDLSGRLSSALSSPAMTAATNDHVISFLNTDVLNTQAKHWYRVNYGAAGPSYSRAGGHEAQTFTIKINGRPVATLRDDNRPAPTSFLPTRFFWGGDVIGDRIIPLAPGVMPGFGSRPAHFTDLGFRVIAEEFGPAYTNFFTTWVRQGKNRANLAAKNIHMVADVRLESVGFTVDVR